MATLCLISVIDNQAFFFEYLKRNGCPPSACRGYGSIYGDIPEIGTTMQISYCDYEGEATWITEKPTKYFKVIHIHRYLVPNENYINRSLTEGVYDLSCTIYVTSFGEIK